VRLKDFIGRYGKVWYQRGKWQSKDIERHFVKITPSSGVKVKPGDLVWAEYVETDKAGYSLVPVKPVSTPAPTSSTFVYHVPDEEGLMMLLQRNEWAVQRVT
jgi:hypothetical protein